MSQILTIIAWDEKRQFATLSFAHNRRFHDFLRLGIKPMSYREFDPANGKWRVHLSKLPLVVAYARRHFAVVNYRILPEWVQLRIASFDSSKAGEDSSPSVRPTREIGPYETLHLIPSAPWEVIRAAYKALVLLHHPDRGGSTETLQRINKAYAELEESVKRDEEK